MAKTKAIKIIQDNPLTLLGAIIGGLVGSWAGAIVGGFVGLIADETLGR